MNRETWLNALAAKMAPRFVELGRPIPNYRVSVGWTSAGDSHLVRGECWHSSASSDKVFEILIAPTQDDPLTVSAILAHELGHAAAGFEHGHKGDFAKLMAQLGLVRPFTTATPSPAFVEWVTPFLADVGPIPHARIMLRNKGERGSGGGGDGADGGDDGEIITSSNKKKKQTTRMLKATCTAEMPGKDGGDPVQCGYTVRLSKKWAVELGACCPAHGAMEVEGADSAGGDDDADQQGQ